MAITHDPDSPVKICTCCGKAATGLFRSWVFKEHVLVGRCRKHVLANPCVVEGCRRVRLNRKFRSETNFLCVDHWRIFCPPRSRMRAAYHRFFRLAKKLGVDESNPRWPEDLENRYWRFWFALVRRAQRGNQEALDEKAINEMFGWNN